MSAKATKTVCLRLDPDLYDQVKEAAHRSQVAMSTIVHQILKDYLDSKEKDYDL
jgi:predicted transcriptional regulator